MCTLYTHDTHMLNAQRQTRTHTMNACERSSWTATAAAARVAALSPNKKEKDRERGRKQKKFCAISHSAECLRRASKLNAVAIATICSDQIGQFTGLFINVIFVIVVDLRHQIVIECNQIVCVWLPMKHPTCVSAVILSYGASKSFSFPFHHRQQFIIIIRRNVCVCVSLGRNRSRCTYIR